MTDIDVRFAAPVRNTLPDIAGREITVDDLLELDKLMPVDKALELLSITEPISGLTAAVGANIHFTLDSGWNSHLAGYQGTDTVKATVSVGGNEHQLSKDAILGATSIIGLPKAYVTRAPAELTEQALNYWLGAGKGLGDKEYKLLLTGPNRVAAAITKATISPFSNVRMVNDALEVIHDKYGDVPVYVDSKLHHSLRRTHIRLVLPEQRKLMPSTEAHDNWFGGIEIVNSLTGEQQTTLSGYLFRVLCTNGLIDTRAASGAWSRRGNGNEDDVYEWARASVDDVLGGMEASFEGIEQLTRMRIDNEVGVTLRDVFEQFSVPIRARVRVVTNMVENDELSMYSIANAITQAANESVSPEEARELMGVGGQLVEHAQRCDNCHRLIV